MMLAQFISSSVTRAGSMRPALALCGCANEALNQQLATSREAVDQARIVGAAETAPADFQVALDKMDRASAAADEPAKG
jgi:hypothetical protein